MGFGPNSLIEKEANAGAALGQFLILKKGTNDDDVIQATAVSEEFIGVSQVAATAANQKVRVMLSGISKIKLGGTVTQGQWLTTDANGCGVAAAPASGVNNAVIGRAMTSGVANDIGLVLIAPGRIQG